LTPNTDFQKEQFEDGKVVLYVDGINYDITDATTFTSKNDYFSINAGEKISIQVVGTVLDSNEFT
jgi:hypothetical protein